MNRYQQQLKDAMVDALHEGANAWLRAVVGRVPLWSGMARASLLELSQLINGTIVFTPLKTKSRIPRGQVLGTAKQIIQDGKAIITITTNVPHYNVQEFSSGKSPSAPWRSLLAGANAWRDATQDFRPVTPEIKPVRIKVN